MLDVILKRFDQPDETRTFAKGKFELVRIGGMTIGRATYDPGWKWSVDVGAPAGLKQCTVEHVGLVISGKAVAAMADGRVIEIKAGDLFYIAPGHDSWVVGDQPYVSLHFMGAADYARHDARWAQKIRPARGHAPATPRTVSSRRSVALPSNLGTAEVLSRTSFLLFVFAAKVSLALAAITPPSSQAFDAMITGTICFRKSSPCLIFCGVTGQQLRGNWSSA